MKKLLLLLFLLLAFPHPSLAFYGDAEDFQDNAISTTILDLVLGSGQTNFSPDPDLLEPGDIVTRDYSLSKTTGSQSLKFNASYQFLSGNSLFCQQFNLKIKSGLVILYDQSLTSLSGFTHPDFLIDSATAKNYLFEVTLPNTTPPEFQDQTCHFKFVFTAWQEEFSAPVSGFIDVEDSENTLTADPWDPPRSWITTAFSNPQSTSPFAIDYDSENNVDYVELWYSYNLGPWTLFGHHHPNSPGSFDFTSPRAAGYYRFVTKAVAHNGQQETPDWTAFVETTVDAASPLTTLSLPEFGSNRFASRDLLQNGNFADPIPLANWQVGGSGDHTIILDGSNQVAQIGWSQSSPVAGSQDYVYQILPLPSDPATLSFRYNFSSYDIADNDQFNVYLKDLSDNTLETVWHVGNYTGASGSLYQTGWQEITHSLANFTSSPVKLWFEVSNQVDSLWHTWTDLDDIHVTIGSNNLAVGTTLTINATDATGTGVVAVNYQIGGSPPETSSNPVSLAVNVGTTLTYWSEDAVGHTDTPTTINLLPKATLGQIVINRFAPDPALGLDEIVWLYNTQVKPGVGDTDPKFDPVDVGGTSPWKICHNLPALPKHTDPLDPNYHPDPSPDECVDIQSSQNPDPSVPDADKTKISPETEIRLVTNFHLADGQDTIFLLDPAGKIIDSYQYQNAREDIVYKRNPVGTGSWSDPETTNLLENYLYTTLSGDKAKFKLFGLPDSGQYDLELTYQSDTLEKGIYQSHTLTSPEPDIIEFELFLGTCTSGGTCTPDQNISNIRYLFTLTRDGQSRLLEKNIN